MIGSKMKWANTEWYRNACWSPANRELFFAKLARARDKAQYAAIQAAYLVESDDPTDWHGAVEILSPLFDPRIAGDEFSTVAMTYGRGLEELGLLKEALDAYRQSMKAMRDRHQFIIICNSHYFFARCVAEAGIQALFGEALAALNQNPAMIDGKHLSRGNHFSDLAARALIASTCSDEDAAILAEHAFAALDFTANDWPRVSGMSRRSARTVRLIAALLKRDHPLAIASR
jgi:hypothetical protein